MKTKIKLFFAHPAFLLLIRLVVGGIFVLFGAVKAFEPKTGFFQSISDYQMLPDPIIPYFAYAVIAAEIIVGLGFLFGVFTRWSAIGVAGLLLMFMIAIGQAIARGLELSDCGCSGSLIQLGETPWTVLSRDAIMFLGVLWFLKVKNYRWTIDYWLEDHHIDVPGEDTHNHS